jgi:proteic killer suppression protein
MIKTFRHKPLADLFEAGTSGKIDNRLHRRILIRLDALNDAALAEDLRMPGYDFHPLKGFDPTRYSIHVNGPWCITFEFAEGDAYKVDSSSTTR